MNNKMFKFSGVPSLHHGHVEQEWVDMAWRETVADRYNHGDGLSETELNKLTYFELHD